MTRPKYKALWLAEKHRADGLQHQLKRWKALIPAFEKRGAEVMQQLCEDKQAAELFNRPHLRHKVTRLDFEALALALHTHRMVSVPDGADLGFVRITFEGVPVELLP